MMEQGDLFKLLAALVPDLEGTQRARLGKLVKYLRGQEITSREVELYALWVRGRRVKLTLDILQSKNGNGITSWLATYRGDIETVDQRLYGQYVADPGLESGGSPTRSDVWWSTKGADIPWYAEYWVFSWYHLGEQGFPNGYEFVSQCRAVMFYVRAHVLDGVEIGDRGAVIRRMKYVLSMLQHVSTYRWILRYTPDAPFVLDNLKSVLGMVRMKDSSHLADATESLKTTEVALDELSI